MHPSHSFAEVDPWTKVAQAALLEGKNYLLPPNHDSTLHIDVALSSTTAHTGTEIIVQVNTDAAISNANWSTLTRFIGPIGTAVDADFGAQEAVGQTTLTITNPVTENMDRDKKFKFVEHATDASSEIVYQLTSTDDTGDAITILDGLTNQQETTSNIYDIDNATDEVVGQYAIDIPPTARNFRILYNNNYHAGGSQVHVRARISVVTQL